MTRYLMTIFAAIGLATAIGCSSDDDDAGNESLPDAGEVSSPDGGEPIEPSPTEDAGTGGMDDADGGSTGGDPGVNALGTPCTGDGMLGQGSCPDGHRCLTLQSGSWCSKECGDLMDPVCSTGYTGPGFPACFVQVQDQNQALLQACGVICGEEQPGSICPPGATCDGTCPGQMTCEAPINNQMMQKVATACQ